jgi:hypothetical protein
MSRVLREQLANLEHQRADLLAGLARLSREQLEYRPDPGSWSIADVIDHLAATEEVLVQMGERIRAGGAGEIANIEAAAGWRRPRGIRGRIRWLVRRAAVYGVISTGIRVRMPRRVKQMIGTPNPASAAEAVARWEAARTRLAAYVTGLAPADERRKLLHHPIAGWFDHRQGLAFVGRHVRHHARQIGRVRRGLANGAAG